MQKLLQQKVTDMSLDEMLTQDMESTERAVFWELG